ncbi:12396_t:CDS:2, partial [Racocetra fulgida]
LNAAYWSVAVSNNEYREIKGGAVGKYSVAIVERQIEYLIKRIINSIAPRRLAKI